jgi:hypothetical protein
MINVIVLGIVGASAILLAAAYLQSRKTRKELISEMEEEILSNEPAPVEAPAPVVAKVEPVPAAVEEVTVAPAPVVEEVIAPAPVVAKETKAEVKEMVAAQEAPIEKPKPKRKRPAKKKPAQS